MKIRFTMKTPDAAADSINEAVSEKFPNLEDDVGEIEREQQVDDAEDLRCTLTTLSEKWFSCGEYVTIEMDTINGTMTVVPRVTD